MVEIFNFRLILPSSDTLVVTIVDFFTGVFEFNVFLPLEILNFFFWI